MKKYLLVIWGDTDPEVMGPYTEDERDTAAKNIREEGGDDNGIFMLNAAGTPTVEAYSGAFFEEDDDDNTDDE